ncbi:MAG TPA: glycosyltransferase family 39 protein [Longimicrobiales bacterium]
MAVWAFVAIFLLGAGARAVDVWRGADGAVRDSWRECDIAAVARNFYREGMNILYPRIDWRGEGPGYAEMEFPLLPWMMAASYEVGGGVHEVNGRVMSYLFSLATLLVFFSLARRLLPWEGALAASLFFALSPLSIRISNALQSEGLMFLGYVLAAYAFLRWLDEDSGAWFGVAAAATALAILAKATAAHIGLLFLLLLLERRGRSALRAPRVWAFAAIALLPGILWYLHARGLWLRYGNSLGVSNESHWVGRDFFTDPTFILGITRLELLRVWMPAGALVAAAGVLARPAPRAVRTALYWLAGIGIYYLAAARTTGDSWAVYYHVVAVPPAALLFGAGAAWVMRRIRVLPASLERGWAGIGGAALTVGLAAAMALAFADMLRADVRLARPHGMRGQYACAQSFARHVPEDALILATGGTCVDASGRPVAYNASYMFYWMDRKGFNICRQERSLEKVRSFVARGAKFFVAEKRALDGDPAFRDAMLRTYPIVAECPVAYLFRLEPAPGAAP